VRPNPGSALGLRNRNVVMLVALSDRHHCGA
jgi:hypothetical protein